MVVGDVFGDAAGHFEKRGLVGAVELFRERNRKPPVVVGAFLGLGVVGEQEFPQGR